MSRRHVFLLTAALAAGSSSCGEETKPTVPTVVRPSDPSPGRPSDPPVAEPGSVGAPKEAREKLEQNIVKADEVARGLLASFDARTYDPRREGLLDRLEGEVVLLADGKEGRYSFAFDRTKPPAEAMKFQAVAEPPGWDAALAGQARRWVNLTCIGAYSYAAYHVPPIKLALVPCSDKDCVVVLAPSHRTPLNVSYVVHNQKQIVTDRGEWTDEDHRFVTHFDWQDWRGRQVLTRTTTRTGQDMNSGPVADFTYDEREGLRLVRVVRVVDGAKSNEARFTYRNVVRRAP